MDVVLVTVVDTTAPDIMELTASRDVLWPPNNKMRPVALSISFADLCDDAPACLITAVSSNEPVTGEGDVTSPDWEITGLLSLELRAERLGEGSGRVYTITVQCTDASGNTATQTVDVLVPHDQGNND